MSTLSQMLTSIYRAARELPASEFQNFALDLLRMQLLDRLYEGKHERRSGLAISDQAGLVCSSGPDFTPLMQTEWPQWNGQHLPEDLLVGLGNGQGQGDGKGPGEASFAGQSITVTASADAGFYFLRARKRSTVDTLSPRERDIARRFADGSTHKEIAQTLAISPATVRNHLQAVYVKLQTSNKTGLARLLGE